MFFFMTTNKKQQFYPLCFYSWRPIKKQQCYPLCFLSWRPIKNNSVAPYVFFHDDQSKTSVTPYGFFHDDQRKTTVSPLMFHLIKTTVLPLMFFFPRWLMKNNSVTPYILFDRDNFFIFFKYDFFMTTNKIRQCYPLYFIWQRQQCYPLCFFSWRPIKNNSVTPYVFIHDDQ